MTARDARRRPFGRASAHRPLAQFLVALLAALALVGCSPHTSDGAAGSSARSSAATATGTCPTPKPSTAGASISKLPLRSLCALPTQAGQTWHLIDTGAKLPYPRDGIVFNNAERILPQENRGYYHEYTVPTPGAKTRGARRLITGSEHELYYTGDHYRSFVVVDSSAVAGG
ncbi:MAG TPA: ribonuclease domain-containing protein [Pseudonocardia sp.]|nr:ribonuclease domain-containing protein [Pseudonocardia sp.]